MPLYENKTKIERGFYDVRHYRIYCSFGGSSSSERSDCDEIHYEDVHEQEVPEKLHEHNHGNNYGSPKRHFGEILKGDPARGFLFCSEGEV